MKRTFCSIICLLCLFGFSQVVSAQVRPSTFSVTPYVGGYLFDKDQKVGNAPVYGISLGYNITKHFGVEASGEYVSTNYDLPVADSRSSNVGNYRLDGIINLIPDSRFVPFIFAGFGGQSIDYPKGVPNRAATAVDYGAGLKYFFNDRIALRADVRQIYIFDDSRKDIEYTLGLSFFFGGSKPAPIAKTEPTPLAEPRVEEKVIMLKEEPPAETKEQMTVAAEEPKTVILVLEEVHFDFDQSTLKPEAQVILKKNIERLKENPKVNIIVAGHASASGTEAYNQKLSERRAAAVKTYLIKEGFIVSDRLSTIGYGETRPAVHEVNPRDRNSAAAKANMRVVFEIVVK